MNLYNVEITAKLVVLAKTEKEAIQFVNWSYMCNLDGTTADFTMNEITNEKELPEGWSVTDLPFGNSEDYSTIQQILMEKEERKGTEK